MTVLLFFFAVTTALYLSVEPGHRIYEWKWAAAAVNAGVFGLLYVSM